MTLPFRHRVSGMRTRRAPARSVPGIWEVGEGGEGVRLNGVVPDPGDLLVPDGARRWVFRGVDGETVGGDFEPGLLPDAADAENLRALAERIRVLLRAGAPPAEWLGLPPLVPEISDEVRLTEFERSLGERLEHLRAVCRRPRSHLHTELQTVPVGRARRVPLRALSRLASHPEEWERRTLFGVRPRQVLAAVNDERLDIYENRIAARLLDLLLDRVGRRITRVRRLLKLIQAGADYGEQAGGTTWRGRRVFRLWGKMEIGETERALAESTLHALLGLRVRLLPLLDSPLYRGVPRHARVPGALKHTNILAKDAHYREVAALWRECVRLGRARPLTPHERYDQEQALASDFSLFVRLLVVHALDACGLALGTSGAAWAGGKLVAHGCAGDVVTETGETGSLDVSAGDGVPLLRIVPVLASLSRGGEAAAAEALAQIVADDAEPERRRARRTVATAAARVPVVVVYLGRTAERERLSAELRTQLYRFGAQAAERGSAPVELLPVSLDEIDSVERVARALRWRVLGTLFTRFPARLSVPSTLRAAISASSTLLPAGSSGRYVLVNRPRADEAESLAREVERAVQAARGRGRSGAGDAHTLEAFGVDLENAEKLLGALQTCPVCAAEGERENGFVFERDCFSCACGSCSTQWGLRRCARCGERFPYLAPPLPQRAVPAPSGPEWLDQMYGADVLAEPCRVCAAAGVYVCPQCSQCGREHV
jgi:hypothetical protein